jgi:outer membrane protein OmpA-like peptidoglycan-associated protein
MKSNYFYTLFFASITLIGVSQTKTLLKANKYYGLQAYAEAIPFYEKAIRNDSNNKLILSNLGDCYRNTNNTKGQILCYNRLVRTGKAESIHKLYLGQALMQNGDYDRAKTFMNDYSNDARGKTISKGLVDISRFSKNEDAYKVTKEGFNSEDNDFSAVNYRDNNIIFASTRRRTKWINKEHGWTNNQYLNLFITRKNPSGGYLPPQLFMKDLQSKFNDGPVCFSKDYNTVYFTRNSSSEKLAKAKDGTYKLRLLEAKLNANGFDKVSEFPYNNAEYNCAHPSISADGNTLYFSSDMQGSIGGMDIWMSKKGSDDKWGKPENLGDKVNTAGNELFPFITENNILYFSSNGLEGLGGLDVYETKIKDDKATRVYNMGTPINGKYDDFAYNLNSDGKNGYFSSNREKGGLNDDVYSLNILREVKRGKGVKVITKDKSSGELLANTAIEINGEKYTTNEKGEYETVIEEDTKYVLSASRDKYTALKDSVTTLSSPEDDFTKELLMEKIPNFSLLAFVLDAKTNKAIEGVKVTIKDLYANKPFDSYTTPANGEYKKPLEGKKIGDKLIYEIKLEKEGYLSKMVNFTYDLTKEGEVLMNNAISLTMGKVEVGMDLAKMIDIKPIYFDLGKATIRKDASVELDKVVAVMKQYPTMVIELGSHTDCRSSAASNLKLSDKRAKASAAYIVSKGVEKIRIYGKGFGESKLLNGCACEGKIKPSCSEEEHQKNRRTEFIIVKVK